MRLVEHIFWKIILGEKNRILLFKVTLTTLVPIKFYPLDI